MEYIDALSKTVKSTDCPIVQAFRGGRTPGTWGHPISVTSYLQYLSSDEKIEVRKDQGGYEEIFLIAGQYRAYLISESGLYKLIMRSDKPRPPRRPPRT